MREAGFGSISQDSAADRSGSKEGRRLPIGCVFLRFLFGSFMVLTITSVAEPWLCQCSPNGKSIAVPCSGYGTAMFFMALAIFRLCPGDTQGLWNFLKSLRDLLEPQELPLRSAGVPAGSHRLYGRARRSPQIPAFGDATTQQVVYTEINLAAHCAFWLNGPVR